jgi:hypothetical protein
MGFTELKIGAMIPLSFMKTNPDTSILITGKVRKTR